MFFLSWKNNDHFLMNSFRWSKNWSPYIHPNLIQYILPHSHKSLLTSQFLGNHCPKLGNSLNFLSSS
jgi:hypothetical protein